MSDIAYMKRSNPDPLHLLLQPAMIWIMMATFLALIDFRNLAHECSLIVSGVMVPKFVTSNGLNFGS